MHNTLLLQQFDLLATAPGGVAKLRELILTLAVQGKLVPQDPSDEPASELLKRIRAEKDRLMAEGKIKRDKPLAPIGEDEQPFGLPSGWEWVRLIEIGNWAIGSGFPHEAQGREGLPILFAKVSDMNLLGNELNIVRTNHTIDVETVAKLRVNVHSAGTVIFPKIGGAIATNKRRILVRPTAIDNNCLGITPSEVISTRYLYLLLTSIDFTEYQAGTSVPALSQGTLGLIAIGLPPLPEQARIVARVEELMRVCDALEATNQRQAAHHRQLVQTLLGDLTADSHTPWQRVAAHFDTLLDRPSSVDALEQTILQLAVRGQLVPQDPSDEPASELLKRIRAEKDRLIAAGKIKRDKPLTPIGEDEQPFELPPGWEWVPVGSVGMTQTGGTPASNRPEYFDGNFPFIGPGQIAPEGVVLPPEKHISIIGAAQSTVAEVGDILMVCIGGSIGKCAAATYVTAFNQQINSIHPVLALSDYVLLAMSSSEFTDVVIRTSTGSATPIISRGKWDLLPFPLPPLPEQARIVARVAQLRRLCADLRQRLAQSQTTQATLAEALVAEIT